MCFLTISWVTYYNKFYQLKRLILFLLKYFINRNLNNDFFYLLKDSKFCECLIYSNTNYKVLINID